MLFKPQRKRMCLTPTLASNSSSCRYTLSSMAMEKWRDWSRISRCSAPGQLQSLYPRSAGSNTCVRLRRISYRFPVFRTSMNSPSTVNAPHSRLYARVSRLKRVLWLRQQGGCKLSAMPCDARPPEATRRFTKQTVTSDRRPTSLEMTIRGVHPPIEVIVGEAFIDDFEA